MQANFRRQKHSKNENVFENHQIIEFQSAYTTFIFERNDVFVFQETAFISDVPLTDFKKSFTTQEMII